MANTNANGRSRPQAPADLKCPIDTDVYTEEAILSTLPLYFRSRDPQHTIIEISKSNIADFIKRDTDVSRLNDIYDHMWACGRPLNARPLHRQLMMKREVVLTEQADLHLLYHDSILYVKPLPAYLLSRPIWNQYLIHDAGLHADACGLLLSYTWLLCSPVDFTLAREAKLLPEGLDWTRWRVVVHEFFGHVDPTTLHQVNRRYYFGELRLHRINSAYRMVPRLAINHFVRGYLYGYNRYTAFFQRSVGWILVVFFWFSLILSAMQVGISIPDFQHKSAFTQATFGFVVYSITQVAALVLFLGALFVGVFLYNMVAAISHAKKQEKRRNALVDGGKVP